MEHSNNSKRCKWSQPATNLLLSIWSHNLVQKQLKASTRNQPIWESIARFMTRKGFKVTGLQCRTRIKNMLCTYQESIKKDSRETVPYFDIFKEVLDKKGLKDQTSSNSVKPCYSKENAEECDNSKDSTNSYELKPSKTDNEYEMEFLEETNNDSQYCYKINIKNEIRDMQNAIVQAIHSQTKTIVKAVELQSQMIERLITGDK